MNPMKPLAMIARHVNASTPSAVPEETLLGAFRTGEVPPAFTHHVRAALDETDQETMMDLVLSGAVSYGGLAALADRLLPENHGNRRWLDARRSL